MRVIKFFTKKPDDGKIDTYVWYIEDSMKPSKIIEKIESFLRQNQLICYLSSFVLFASAKEYEASIKTEIVNSKNKYLIS